MLLANVAHFNDLSPELRKKLEDKVDSLGTTVRYRFKIEHDNPDPEKYGGKKVIFPALYTLDPAVFSINDPYEKRSDKSRSKRIGLVDGVDEKNLPNRFRKIKLYDRDRGIYVLNLKDDPEHRDFAMYLELHPKMEGGLFSDKSRQQIFSRIDENAFATQQRKERSIRKVAMDTAEKMSDAEVLEFAQGMLWDDTQEIGILRNMAEDIAESTPEMFNDIVNDKRIKYRAAIKRAVDNKIFNYNPDDCKLTWASNSQIIVTLGRGELDNDYERLGDWLMTGGTQAEQVYKKLQSLEKSAKPVE